ncbi:hypothetical protein FOCC_FOCC008430, partial [Frankliniella occidentalis]
MIEQKSKMHVTRQQLSTDNPEYQEVSAVFRKGAKTKDFVLSIEAIEKVTNPTLQQAFDINKAIYRRQYGHVRTVKVFHGTKITNIPSILKNNLEVRRHGQNRGHRFGAGVSFSAISNYSSHYCDENVPVKQMLLCLVLVSNIIEVPEMKKKRYTICEPPFLEGHWPLRYDTTAKNKTTMDVIVKFEDHTFYPAFVNPFSYQGLSKMITIGLQPIAPCIVTHIQFILLVHMFLYGLNISLLNITLSHFILEPNHNQPPIKRKILL